MSYKLTERQKLLLKQIANYHLSDCPSIDWKKRANEPFNKDELGPNENVWIKKSRNYQPLLIEKMLGIDKLKIKYWKFKRIKAKKKDLILYEDWKENLPFVKNMLAGNQEAWREAVRKYAPFYKESKIAQAFSLHVYDEKTVECDVFLRNINDIVPKKIEKVTKRGYIRYHDMPKTNRYKLYESYVYSCLLRIARDLFAVLPCEIVYLNAMIGSREEHSPVISTVLEYKFNQLLKNPKLIIQEHRLMESFKKRSGFQPIERVYSPTS